MKTIKFSSSDVLRILKSSDKYLIGIAKNSTDDNFVFKIANKDNESLNKEVNRINELRNQYPFMKKRFAPILDHGVIEEGYHKGKCYYLSPLMPGDTFSHFVQEPSVNHLDIKRAFYFLITEILKFCRDHKFDPGYNQSSGSLIKSYIKQSIFRFNDLPNIRVLLELDNLKINQYKKDNINKVVNQILDHPSVKKLDELNSFISEVGHWNFHGDIVLIEDLKAPEKFKVIDPDINIDTCDPLFTLARFLYTYPHDTADYNQYIIESNCLYPTQDKNIYFNIRTMWPQVVSKLYSGLFNSILPQHSSKVTELVTEFGNENELLRLELSYLLCLLRGVSANYEDIFTIPSGKLNFFQNKGIFLYLQTGIFANNMRDKLYGN